MFVDNSITATKFTILEKQNSKQIYENIEKLRIDMTLIGHYEMFVDLYTMFLIKLKDCPLI